MIIPKLTVAMVPAPLSDSQESKLAHELREGSGALRDETHPADTQQPESGKQRTRGCPSSGVRFSRQRSMARHRLHGTVRRWLSSSRMYKSVTKTFIRRTTLTIGWLITFTSSTPRDPLRGAHERATAEMRYTALSISTLRSSR